jgi:hypothetical protein
MTTTAMLDKTGLEKAGRAIYEAKSRNKPWDILPVEFQRQYIKQAEACASAYLTHVAGLCERLRALVDTQIDDNLDFIKAADSAMSEAATTLLALSAENAGMKADAEIADAVLSWMVKFDLLDAGNEYRASDVLAVLDDLAPSARAEAAEARVKEMVAAGAPLANIAFNLSQRSGLSEQDRTLLDECRKAWDAARSLSPIKVAGSEE